MTYLARKFGIMKRRVGANNSSMTYITSEIGMLSLERTMSEELLESVKSTLKKI